MLCVELEEVVDVKLEEVLQVLYLYWSWMRSWKSCCRCYTSVGCGIERSVADVVSVLDM